MATASGGSTTTVGSRDIKHLFESRKFVDVSSKVLLYIVLTLALVALLMPAYWMVITSFKTGMQIPTPRHADFLPSPTPCCPFDLNE